MRTGSVRRIRLTRRRLIIAAGAVGAATLVLASTALAATITRYEPTQIIQPIHTAFGAGQEGELALSSDGSTALVGAPDANGNRGLVSFYTREGSRWVQRQTIADPNDTPGDYFSGVALSANGDTAMLTAFDKKGGSNAYVAIYARTGNTWALQQTIQDPNGPSNLFFGALLSFDGNTAFLADGGTDSERGTVLVFTRTATSWTLHQTIEDPLAKGSPFGAVALSGDGTTAIMGAGNGNGSQQSIIFFVDRGGTWTEQGPAIPDPLWNQTAARSDNLFGAGAALSENGDTALVSAPLTNLYQGAILFYTRTGDTWTRTQTIINPAPKTNQNDFIGGEMGASVALSANGDTALVGAPGVGASGAGAVYEYSRTGATWTRQQTLPTPAPGGFGVDVTLSANADYALVGAPGYDHGVGAVVAFARKAAVIPNLSVLWTLEHDWVQAQITPKPGTSHYALFATRTGAAGRTGVCKLVNTGLGRRLRCSFTLSPGTWTLTAQAESTAGVIAQTVHRAKVS